MSTTGVETGLVQRQPEIESVEARFSRRDVLRWGASAMAAAAITAASSESGIGVSFNKPQLEVYPRFFGRTSEDVAGAQLLSFDHLETDREDVVSITKSGKILIEPDGYFFYPGRMFDYVHRGGNSFEAIHESYELGADMYDMDAIVVGPEVYGEHGMMFQLRLNLGWIGLKFEASLVFDPNEKEVTFGAPNTYDELLAEMARLNREVAASTELKRGEFDRDKLRMMINAHLRHRIPAILHPTDPSQLEALGIKAA